MHVCYALGDVGIMLFWFDTITGYVHEVLVQNAVMFKACIT